MAVGRGPPADKGDTIAVDAPSRHPPESRLRQCETCGATVQLPAEALSVTCAFCDSPLVAATEHEEPVERIVSFVLDRSRAATRLARHLANRWLAPEPIRQAAAAASIRPVLVPFYAFDAETTTRFTARVGIHWWRTETYTVTEDGKTVQKTRQVQETDWHELTGTHRGQWFDHLVSASRGLSEAETNALAPYDLGRSRPWSPALLAGLEAEWPVVDHATAEATARRGIRARAEARVTEEHLPGDVNVPDALETQLELGDVELVLLPVWIATVPSSKGELRLLVNGQTGEVIGRVPVSPTKVAALVLAVAVIVLAGVWLLGGAS
ncbi:MAG: hypothetical protein AAF602_27310 [Myxococcota bacterium]